MSRPRIFKVAALFTALIVLTLAGAHFRSVRRAEVRLSDGSTLSLDAVTTGPEQIYRSEPLFLTRLREHLPPRLESWLGPTPLAGGVDGTHGELTLWFRRRPSEPGKWMGTPRYSIVAVGKDGERFHPHSGSTMGGTSTNLQVNSHSFRVLPRRDRTLRFEVLEGAISHQIEVDNPISFPRGGEPGWQPLPLPLVQSAGDLSVTIQSIELRRFRGRIDSFAVHHTVAQSGRACDGEWDVRWTACDPTGNCTPTLLPLDEPVWRLIGQFRPNATARFPADVPWSLGNVTAIRPGVAQKLDVTRIAANGVDFAALLGPGDYRLTNGLVANASTRDTSKPGTRSSQLRHPNWGAGFGVNHPRLVLVCHGEATASTNRALSWSKPEPGLVARIRDVRGQTWPGQLTDGDFASIGSTIRRVFAWEFRLPADFTEGVAEVVPSPATEFTFTVEAPRPSTAGR